MYYEISKINKLWYAKTNTMYLFKDRNLSRLTAANVHYVYCIIDSLKWCKCLLCIDDNNYHCGYWTPPNLFFQMPDTSSTNKLTTSQLALMLPTIITVIIRYIVNAFWGRVDMSRLYKRAKRLDTVLSLVWKAQGSLPLY